MKKNGVIKEAIVLQCAVRIASCDFKLGKKRWAGALPSQASYAVLAEESQAFFKLSQHTNSISNSAILRNNYILLLSDLCACVHVKKNGVIKEAIVLL